MGNVLLVKICIAIAAIGTPIVFIGWLYWMDSMVRTKAIKKFKDNVRKGN